MPFYDLFSYDRCCNPLQLHNHNKRESLRNIMPNVSLIFPHLTGRHRICSACRKKVTKLGNTRAAEIRNEHLQLQQGKYCYIIRYKL